MQNFVELYESINKMRKENENLKEENRKLKQLLFITSREEAKNEKD